MHAGHYHSRVRVAAHASTLCKSEPMSTSRLQQVFGGSSSALLLERSLGARAGADADLWHSVPFLGGVVPDLPVASNWAALLQTAFHRWV